MIYLGDTFDILALINNSINFTLYCLMSRAFRDTFKQTFSIPCGKYDHQESAFSFTQMSMTKKRPDRLISSMSPYEHVLSPEQKSTKLPLLDTNGMTKSDPGEI